MNQQVYKWVNRLLDGLFPPRCPLCDAPTQALQLCRGCRADLPDLQHACRQCARPLQAAADRLLCGQCQRHPPAFDRTIAPFHYAPPLDYLVKQLKFSNNLALGPLLAGLLGERLQLRSAALPELLVPVPLHSRRLRERGYNQALELARPLARQLSLPVNTNLCRRIRHTQTQSLLVHGARRRNVRNAFALRGQLRATHVAILDDVMTTGCTAGELARQLKRAGAEKVEVWVVARTG